MYSGDDMFEQNVFNALNSLYKNIQETVAGNVKTKEAKGNVILDFAFSKDKHVEIIESDGTMVNEEGTIIQFNPKLSLLLLPDRFAPKNKGQISPESNLAHEFGHSWLAQFSPILNKEFEYVDRNDGDSKNEHSWILTNVENKFSTARKEGSRNKYRGTYKGWSEYNAKKKELGRYFTLGDIVIIKK